jgi:plasmid maintenance system antidote protein VapI
MNAMKEQNVTFSELARRIGHTRTSVSGWIYNPGRMKVDYFFRICKALGKTMDEMMEGVWTD